MPGYPVEPRPFTQADLDAYFSGDRVVCLRCGKKYKSLGVHVLKIHGVTPNDYRQMYGIPWTYGLTCEATERAYGDASKRWIEGNRDQWEERLRASRVKIAEGKYPHRQRVPATIEGNTNRIMAAAHIEREFEPADYAAVLEQMATGRTLREVLDEPGRPKRTAFSVYKRKNPAFAAAFARTVEAQPFAIQAKAEMLGARFEAAVRELFDKGQSDHTIAEALGVTAMSVNRRTKKWRST